jgi:hypothetical protein
MAFASLLGTYLDLFFVGKKFYEFPVRLLPEVFSINIAFTLMVIPLFVFLYLQLMMQVNKWGKLGLVLFVSLLMPIFEKLAEVCGWFVHSKEWNHLYTFFGYIAFLSLIYLFYQWVETKKG